MFIRHADIAYAAQNITRQSFVDAFRHFHCLFMLLYYFLLLPPDAAD